MKRVIYHPEARAELDGAADRCGSRSTGLGNSLIDEAETVVNRIEESPIRESVRLLIEAITV